MEALSLDPNGYAGTYKLIGGRLALDFINTVSWPDTGRRHDWFSKAENVEKWLAAVGLEPRSSTAADRDEIVGLRDVISAVIRPLARGDHPPAATVSALNDVVRSTARRRRVDPETLQWSWAPAQRAIDLFDPVVLDAVEVVTSGRRDRLKHCPSCDWVFEDQTRNGKRRWCDMADCGSRAKSRDYYYRTKN